MTEHVEMLKKRLQEISAIKHENIEMNAGRSCEENVKLKIIIPMLETLDWNLIEDIDAEFPVENRRADFCLKINKIPRIIVEVKSLEQSIQDHMIQATNYVYDLASSVDTLLITNGNDFMLLDCDIIHKKSTKIIEFARSVLPKDEIVMTLLEVLDRDSIARKMSQVKLDIHTFDAFLEHYNSWKNMLFNDLSSQIHELFVSSNDFKTKIKEWCNARAIDMKWRWIEEREKDFAREFYSAILTKTFAKEIIVPKASTGLFWKNYKGEFQKSVDQALHLEGIALDFLDKFAIEGAYIFLNRLLFLRMAEDYHYISAKIFTPEFIGTLYKLKTQKSIYHQLASCFAEIEDDFKAIYTTPLFDSIYYDEMAWSKPILVRILAEMMQFNYATREIDLIGKLYEKSLDTTTRKLLGQFYTDPFLVKYMLGKLEGFDESKRILDPACGSGTFLNESANILHEKMMNKGYSSNDIYPFIFQALHGFDIDPFAVQLSAIKLLLMNLKKSAPQPNLVHCDSLLVSFEGEKQTRLNTQPLKKFDYIVGNPPFFVVKMDEKPYMFIKKECEEIITNNVNIASLFIYKYVKNLNSEGQLAFIFPRSLLHVESYSKIRAFLLDYEIDYIFDLGKAFEDVGLTQIIIIVKNKKPSSDHRVNYALLDRNRDKIAEILEYKTAQSIFKMQDENIFSIFSGRMIKDHVESSINCINILEKMWKLAEGKIAGDYCTKICRGLPLQQESTETRKHPLDLIVIGGRSIFNFGMKDVDTYRFINRRILLDKIKESQQYYLNIFEPKILLQQIVSSRIRIVGTYDDCIQANENEKKIYTVTLDTIECLFLKDQRYAKYILAILLSDLATFILRDFIFMRQTLTIHLDEKYINKIPIIEPSSNQLCIINALVEAIQAFIKEMSIKYPPQARAVPPWETEGNEGYKKYRDLKIKLDDVIYEIYQITAEEKESIIERLHEFEKYY